MARVQARVHGANGREKRGEAHTRSSRSSIHDGRSQALGDGAPIAPRSHEAVHHEGRLHLPGPLPSHHQLLVCESGLATAPLALPRLPALARQPPPPRQGSRHGPPSPSSATKHTYIRIRNARAHFFRVLPSSSLGPKALMLSVPNDPLCLLPFVPFRFTTTFRRRVVFPLAGVPFFSYHKFSHFIFSLLLIFRGYQISSLGHWSSREDF